MFKPFVGLTAKQIKKVQSVYPALKRVQAITGVPWQAVAAIWTRESFSVASPDTPGGPFQFDPIPSPGALRGLLDRFTPLSGDEKKRLVDLGVNDFYAGAILAACFLRLKTGPVIHPKVADSVIQDAMYGYNGRAYGPVDNSPYVMNGIDAAHFPMRLRGSVPDGKDGRIKVDIEDHRPGAFTVYLQLKAVFPA